MWTIRCHNDKGRLLFLCLHFILLISGSLPLALISPTHAYPGYLFHCNFLRRRQWKYYRYLIASRRISVYLIVGNRGRRLLFCPFSLFTHMWGIQFLFLSTFWDFRSCNMWIQMTNSNHSNFSCFFVPLVLVGSQTLATHQLTGLLSILGGLWSDNTKLISTFYFSFFYPVPFHLVMTLLNWLLHSLGSVPPSTTWTTGPWEMPHAIAEMSLRYIRWNRVFGKSSFNLYLYFTPLVSNMNSRDDETNQSDRPKTRSEFPFPSRTKPSFVVKLEIPAF